MSKRSIMPLRATDSGLRLAEYPLGTRQSRAAARALLEARKLSEDDGLRFQVVSIVDGSPVNFDELASKFPHGEPPET
jgi:hypothetical protein